MEKDKVKDISSGNTSGTLTPVEEREVFIKYFEESLRNGIQKAKDKRGTK